MSNHYTFKKAQELRRKKSHVNQDLCEHRYVAREYINGMHSDYICEACGFSHTNREAFRRKPS
ncbi:hypothetical protein NSA56_01910 [Oceanobacillus caeni]|uniref:hypothetical protein n=1 Tax=Oceanobacillus caeni TaxID=405946 RepID=UPI00214A10A4|nr:hypothetical protein [Oceanobacillus caeni]MCR1833152.1 hypothetical protein [Oceanobacillus caeni]